jgi:hypothetical protein
VEPVALWVAVGSALRTFPFWLNPPAYRSLVLVVLASTLQGAIGCVHCWSRPWPTAGCIFLRELSSIVDKLGWSSSWPEAASPVTCGSPPISNGVSKF